MTLASPQKEQKGRTEDSTARGFHRGKITPVKTHLGGGQSAHRIFSEETCQTVSLYLGGTEVEAVVGVFCWIFSGF